MAKKQGLGRGLSALLGEPEDSASVPEPHADGAPFEVAIADIDPNAEQPRRRFDQDALKQLSDSIRSVGVLQPVLLKRDGDRYTLIAGERRWRAARMAGLTHVPAIVRDFDEARRLEASLIENLQRDDLNPIEEANGIRQLMDQCAYTQETVAERLGKSRSAVANQLRLLTLPTGVCDMLRDGRLSAGHGRALLAADGAEKQTKIAQLAAAQGWSVRQLERICSEPSDKPEKGEKPKLDPELAELERMARDVFGTRAKLEGDQHRGKLVLSYFSAEDLQRIWELLESMNGE